MARVEEDPVREERIVMEIVVDAYDAEERAMSWYYYLEDTLEFPFLAKCVAKRAISPLQVGDEIKVLDMAPGEECEHEMFVLVQWEREGLGVPLSQMKFLHGSEQTQEAVEDWHYWVKRGYQF